VFEGLRDTSIPVYLLFFDFGKQMGSVWIRIHLQGFGDNESVQLALSATGPTITAAGLIFAFTFDAGNEHLGIGRLILPMSEVVV